jgi:hypothetical protein
MKSKKLQRVKLLKSLSEDIKSYEEYNLLREELPKRFTEWQEILKENGEEIDKYILGSLALNVGLSKSITNKVKCLLDLHKDELLKSL